MNSRRGAHAEPRESVVIRSLVILVEHAFGRRGASGLRRGRSARSREEGLRRASPRTRTPRAPRRGPEWRGANAERRLLNGPARSHFALAGCLPSTDRCLVVGVSSAPCSRRSALPSRSTPSIGSITPSWNRSLRQPSAGRTGRKRNPAYALRYASASIMRRTCPETNSPVLRGVVR